MRGKIFVLSVLVLIVLCSFVVSATDKPPEVKLVMLNQDPDPVSQGDSVEVRFKIENNGSQTFEDISVEILPKYPFSLYKGSAVQEIGKLKAMQSGAEVIIVKYTLKVDENAVEGDNEIELRLNKAGVPWIIYDQNNFMIDVADYDTPDIKAYIKTNEVHSVGQIGRVTIQIANVDSANVKFVQLTLLPSEDYELLSSSNYVYIGDIDSDDTESEYFDIYSKKAENEEIIIPVSLEYQDSDDHKFENQFDLKIKVYEDNQLVKYGFKEKASTWWVLILVLVVAGYFFWRRRRKAKHDK